MKRCILFLLAVWAATFTYGVRPEAQNEVTVTKTEADNAYQQKDYPRAVALYSQFLKAHPNSASAHYNLGNSYYRLQNYPQAVLHYERALKFNPADSDARFNLSLTQMKIEDQFGEESEMFFIRWFKQLRDQATADTWGVWALVLTFLALCALLTYLFTRPVILRKSCFFGAIALFVMAAVSHTFGVLQHKRSTEPQRAVVMRTSPLRTGPSDTNKASFDLHSGTAVDLIDTTIKGWIEVELSDGRTGWLETKQVEIV